MKKIFLFIAVALFEISIFSQNQNSILPHASSIFRLDTSLSLKYYTEELERNELIATIHQDVLYFCRMKAYQLDENEKKARIYTVNLLTKQQSFFDLDFPSNVDRKFRNVRLYWISGLAIEKDKLVVFAQDKFLIYKKLSDEKYVFNKLVYFYDVDQGYFHDNHLYTFKKDRDKGYFLYRYDTNFVKKKEIRAIPFEAPFLMQFSPNRYLSLGEDCFYILETARPMIKKFSLDGKIVDSVSFSTLYPWLTMPSSLIDKIMQLDYGVDRIFYALKHNDTNSYPTKVFPFKNGNFLIAYHQYNFDRGRPYYDLVYHETFSGVTESGKSTCLRHHLYDEDTLSNNIFPYYCYDDDMCITLPWRNSIIQISKEADVVMQNISVKEYHSARNNYFKHHDPTIIMRILKLKEKNPPFQILESLKIKDYDNTLLTIKDISPKRMIVLFRPPVYCVGCLKEMLRYFDSLNLDTSVVNFAIMIENEDNYLERRQTDKEIKNLYSNPYTSYYMSSEMRSEIHAKLLPYKKTPLILLIDHSKQSLQIMNDEDIFTSNLRRYDFTEEFLKTIEEFLKTN